MKARTPMNAAELADIFQARMEKLKLSRYMLAEDVAPLLGINGRAADARLARAFGSNSMDFELAAKVAFCLGLKLTISGRV